jgi:hypothetical protein
MQKLKRATLVKKADAYEIHCKVIAGKKEKNKSFVSIAPLGHIYDNAVNSSITLFQSRQWIQGCSSAIEMGVIKWHISKS